MSMKDEAEIDGKVAEKIIVDSAVDWSNLRTTEYDVLLNQLGADYRNHVKLTLDQAKGLLCYWLSYKDAGENKNLPWPAIFGADQEDFHADNKEQQVEVYGQDLKALLDRTFEGLTEEEKIDLSEYALKNFDILRKSFDNDDYDIYSLQKLTLEKTPWNTEEARRLGEPMVDLLAKYAVADGVKESFAGPEWVYVHGLNMPGEEHAGMRKIIYRALASNNEIDPKTKRLVFGLVLSHFEPSREFNTLREMMTDQTLDQNERDKVAKLLAMLLGLPEGASVYTSLQECYDSMKFDQYPVSEFTAPMREIFLTELVKELGISPNEKALDIATGSGWLTEVMKKIGLRNTWGLDVNKELLGIAKEKLGSYFAASRWDKLPFASEQCALITCLGRSLPHTENPIDFEAALSEMVRVLKSGGTLVFDMPDSSIGTYRGAIEKNRGIMRSLGAEEETLNNSWIIVDGPKGDKDHFYNRYAPSREIILDTLGSLGLEVDIIEEDIPDEEGNPSGDKNLVFVCRKP